MYGIGFVFIIVYLFVIFDPKIDVTREKDILLWYTKGSIRKRIYLWTLR